MNALSSAKHVFRPEIQGLRALAVLAVIVFHVAPSLVPGGYAGVDVFFVISGYLMTGLLYYEYLAEGTISLKTFYARRIRRLIPASTAVLVVIALAIFLLPQVKWAETAKEIISSSLYVQNWWLASNAVDYWAQDSSPSILMHYWSLSIEEQYYIVWPVLFLAVISILKFFRKPPRYIFSITIAAICMASFIWSVYFTGQNQSLAYFSTFTRIWELALGGLLVIFMPCLKYIPKTLKALSGWVGLFLIIFTCFKFTTQMAFPGYAALLPTLGAVMVIIGGEVHEQWSVCNLLSYKFFQYFGNISYSLYLWHWPVIILYGYSGLQKGIDTSFTDIGIMFCITLTLAHLSKVFIEDSFRQKNNILRHFNAFTILTLSLAITMLAANYVWMRYDKKAVNYNHYNVSATDERMLKALLDEPYNPSLPLLPTLSDARMDRSELYFLGKDPLFHESDVLPYDFGAQDHYTHHIVLVGDSQSAQWTPALERLAETNPALRFTVYTKSSCPFITTSHIVGRNKAEQEACAAWNRGVMQELEAIKPDIVIMGIRRDVDYVDINDSEKEMQSLAEDYLATWKKLTTMGSKVLIIADTPILDYHAVECLSAPGSNVIKCSTPRKKAIGDERLLKLVMQRNENLDVFFLDLNDLICTDKECLPVRGQVLVFRDKRHLTKTFVRLLAPDFAKILRQEYGIPVNN